MIRLAKLLTLIVTSVLLPSFTATTSGGDTTVYICVTGKVYHSTKNCRGVRNATHKIKAISLSEAQKTRRVCKICY